jgi:hypothetical protein
MKKYVYLLFLIPFIWNCKKSTESKIVAEDFKNKTFGMVFNSNEDPILIEFQDSTYQIFNTPNWGILPFGVYNYENSDFLILGEKTIDIKKIDSNTFDCKIIKKDDGNFKMIKRNSKWRKELIYDKWINKNISDLLKSSNDSIKLPPPPSYYDYTERDFVFYPYYEIKEDSIKYYNQYEIYSSNIEINDTSEIITMFLNHQLREEQWQILELNSDFMVVKKQLAEDYIIQKTKDTLVRYKR